MKEVMGPDGCLWWNGMIIGRITDWTMTVEHKETNKMSLKVIPTQTQLVAWYITLKILEKSPKIGAPQDIELFIREYLDNPDYEIYDYCYKNNISFQGMFLNPESVSFDFNGNFE